MERVVYCFNILANCPLLLALFFSSCSPPLLQENENYPQFKDNKLQVPKLHTTLFRTYVSFLAAFQCYYISCSIFEESYNLDFVITVGFQIEHHGTGR